VIGKKLSTAGTSAPARSKCIEQPGRRNISSAQFTKEREALVVARLQEKPVGPLKTDYESLAIQRASSPFLRAGVAIARQGLTA
jgi:hypothetical protein